LKGKNNGLIVFSVVICVVTALNLRGENNKAWFRYIYGLVVTTLGWKGKTTSLDMVS